MNKRLIAFFSSLLLCTSHAFAQEPMKKDLSKDEMKAESTKAMDEGNKKKSMSGDPMKTMPAKDENMKKDTATKDSMKKDDMLPKEMKKDGMNDPAMEKKDPKKSGM